MINPGSGTVRPRQFSLWDGAVWSFFYLYYQSHIIQYAASSRLSLHHRLFSFSFPMCVSLSIWASFLHFISSFSFEFRSILSTQSWNLPTELIERIFCFVIFGFTPFCRILSTVDLSRRRCYFFLFSSNLEIIRFSSSSILFFLFFIPFFSTLWLFWRARSSNCQLSWVPFSLFLISPIFLVWSSLSFSLNFNHF